VWMTPPSAFGGRCFRELFEKPGDWSETRSRIRGLCYADHMLNRQFTDPELGRWLPRIREWGLRFALEVGAVKPWGATGQAAFEAQRPMWERFRRLGGRIDAVALDEPLCCATDVLKKPMAYAVEETARFIALVRGAYPEMQIGDIEPYPSQDAPALATWLDALQARLKALGVRGLDFFQLDVDSVNFTVGNPGGWTGVRRVEEACRSRGIPFALLYWAADQPHLAARGLADESAWYLGMMHQAGDYAIVGGAPDRAVIQSWLEAPSHSVPETGDWTFTRSVRDFCRRFAPRGR